MRKRTTKLPGGFRDGRRELADWSGGVGTCSEYSWRERNVNLPNNLLTGTPRRIRLFHWQAKPGSESGPDCLACTEFARQR